MNNKQRTIKPRIVFMGTPEFGAVILEKLGQSEFKPILVVTETDKPVGRKQIRTGAVTPPPVKVIAQKYSIPIEQPERIENLKLKIENLKPDLIIVAAYGQIIPKDILDIPRYRCINVHPSLLPKYRGPSPIQHAILNGDEETGVTIMLVNEKIDSGPILSNTKYKMSTVHTQQNTKYTYTELSKELAEVGAKLLINTIPQWLKGEIKPRPQDESKATYTKILIKEDGKIDWQKSAEQIERQIRAFSPWPGTFAFLDGEKLKILEVETFICEEKKWFGKLTTRQPGEVFLTEDKQLVVKAGPPTKTRTSATPEFGIAEKNQSSFGAGAIQNSLILRKLQLEGGKPLLAEDFLRGHEEIIGKILK